MYFMLDIIDPINIMNNFGEKNQVLNHNSESNHDYLCSKDLANNDMY